jgi:hypothetical protein
VPAGLTTAGDFGFCFQCQAGSSLVLHRPIEITVTSRRLGVTHFMLRLIVSPDWEASEGS